jgi:hypothetical protein
VFWIRNTIKFVTIVVLVLITSCLVSLKPNTGPLNAHTTTTASAAVNVSGCPAPRATVDAKRVKGEAERMCHSLMTSQRSVRAQGGRLVA